MDDNANLYSIGNKHILLPSRAVLPADGQWCVLVLSEEVLAWCPIGYFRYISPCVLPKTGYRCIPLTAITAVTFKHGDVIYTKKIEVSWRDANGECRVFEAEIEFANLWFQKLDALGLHLEGTQLVDSNCPLGFFYNYGWILWIFGIFVAMVVTGLISGRGLFSPGMFVVVFFLTLLFIRLFK